MNVLIFINDNIFNILKIHYTKSEIKVNVLKIKETELIKKMYQGDIQIENIEIVDGVLKTYGARKNYESIDINSVLVIRKENNSLYTCINQFTATVEKLSITDLTSRKLLNARIVNNKIVPFKGTLNKEVMTYEKRQIQRRSNTSNGNKCERNTGICEQGSKQCGRKVQEQGTVELNGKTASKSVETKSRKGSNTSGLLLHPRLVKSNEFYNKIKEFKSVGKNAASVDVHDIDEYKDMKCFLYDDGKAGVAVEKSGNIVSVFKRPDSSIKGFALKAITDAINNGGTKLDCYSTNGMLPNLYMEAGMKPICKIKFNRDFAPDGWNFERDGEPDIVFMMKCDNIHEFYADYTDEEVPYIYDSDTEDSYTIASRYRDEMLKKQGEHDKSETINKLNKSKTFIDVFKSFKRK